MQRVDKMCFFFLYFLYFFVEFELGDIYIIYLNHIGHNNLQDVDLVIRLDSGIPPSV